MHSPSISGWDSPKRWGSLLGSQERNRVVELHSHQEHIPRRKAACIIKIYHEHTRVRIFVHVLQREGAAPGFFAKGKHPREFPRTFMHSHVSPCYAIGVCPPNHLACEHYAERLHIPATSATNVYMVDLCPCFPNGAGRAARPSNPPIFSVEL